MYGNPPIFLPPTSNREDLLISCSIYDDDTGDPVNLSATATASGMAFTGTSWQVTSGAVSAPFTGSLTIPVPPIGNELSALTLAPVIGAFTPGNAVKIADPTGNNYMLGTVTSYVPATGAMVVQVGSTFQFEIRRGAPRNDGSGYVPYYDFGTPDAAAPLIKAALGTGVTIIDIGFLQILIPEITVRQLWLGTYDAYLSMFDGVATRQVFIAKLPVLYGGVTN
jgi:hypothetical protein